MVIIMIDPSLLWCLQVFIVASSCLAHAVPPELIFDPLLRDNLESGLLSGFQDKMWVILGHSAVSKEILACGCEPVSS